MRMLSACLCLLASLASAEEPAWLTSGEFAWTSSPPLVAPVERPEDPCTSMKDPTIAFHGGRWHLFCTIRSQKRTHQIEYLSFADFKEANQAQRHILKCNDGFFCAPQVFYFTPQKKWYMFYQGSDPNRQPPYGMVYSTSDDLSKPGSWSKMAFTDLQKGDAKAWLDFWIICDNTHAYAFFTSLDGKMWRARTALPDFPTKWSKAEIALQGDIFEASHTYRLKGLNQYLTVIEAQDSGRRYYKAYLADTLDGKWRPLAATREKPFASRKNVEQSPAWTDSISHGELLRAGVDEKLEVDPANLRLLYQGVSDPDKAGKAYGAIPWKLGLLELKKP